MVSMSILGCGLDYSYVCDMVHHGPSYTMMDHYQEDSRGGRDGLECVATTFFVPNQKYSMPTSQYDLRTRVLYDSLYGEVNCLRMATTLYLDGCAVQCISIPGASFCKNCESQCGFIPPPLLLPQVSSPPLPSHVSYQQSIPQQSSPPCPVSPQCSFPPPLVASPQSSILHISSWPSSPLPCLFPRPSFPLLIPCLFPWKSLSCGSSDIFNLTPLTSPQQQSSGLKAVKLPPLIGLDVNSSSQTLSQSPSKRRKLTHSPNLKM